MLKSIALLTLAVVLVFAGCSEKLDLVQPDPLSPLVVTVHVHPDSIPVGYGAGLYAEIEGAKLPLKKAQWLYKGQFLSNANSITFVPDSVRTYEFGFRVKDAADRDTTVYARLQGVPLDSVFFPPDTIQLPPDTVLLPPDTITIIEFDTTYVFDTVFVFDTTLIIDTLFMHDTTVVFDTTYVHDTTFVFDTVFVHDTTIIVDTVIQEVYITDTVYVENLIYKTCKPWIIEEGSMSASIQLQNPDQGTYLVHAFRKRVTENLPQGLELTWDFGDGQIFYTSVHGGDQLVESFWNVTLPQNAMVTITFEEPAFFGKISSTTCWKYFKGNWWWLTQPVSD